MTYLHWRKLALAATYAFLAGCASMSNVPLGSEPGLLASRVPLGSETGRVTRVDPGKRLIVLDGQIYFTPDDFAFAGLAAGDLLTLRYITYGRQFIVAETKRNGPPAIPLLREPPAPPAPPQPPPEETKKQALL